MKINLSLSRHATVHHARAAHIFSSMGMSEQVLAPHSETCSHIRASISDEGNWIDIDPEGCFEVFTLSS